LIVWGGWDGHQPKEVAGIFREAMTQDGFEVEVSETLDVFLDAEKMKSLSLIVPVWTMGKITGDQLNGAMNAVKSGVGMAGCHGGMGDSFREATEYLHCVGGQWCAHPGNDGTRYTVNITNLKSPITEGIKDFEVVSEQYYMLVDPAVKVLASTRFPVADGPHVGNGPVDMPVVWTKMYGQGRVFYNSLGHQANIVASEPCLTLMRRGFKWAAR